MKILHIIPRYTTGGAERLVLMYVKHFAGSDFDMRMASVRGGGELLNEIADQKTIFQGEEGGLPAYARTYKKLQTYIRDWRPDIVHTHIFSADVTGYFLARSMPGLQWVSTQHNVTREHSPFRRAMLSHILPHARRVIAVSEAVRAQVPGSMYIPNGIDVDLWSRSAKTAPLVSDTLRLACIGRLEKQKGQDILFSALKMFSAPWTLHLFGTGSREKFLRRQAAQLGIADRITWHGTVADLPARLDDIDIVVQPSRWEGMSLSVMEAMAAGRLVVASEVAADGLMAHMRTGVMVPTGHIEPFVSALRYADGARDEMRKIAQAGQTFAEEHFGIETHIEQLRALYERLCA